MEEREGRDWERSTSRDSMAVAPLFHRLLFSNGNKMDLTCVHLKKKCNLMFTIVLTSNDHFRIFIAFLEFVPC